MIHFDNVTNKKKCPPVNIELLQNTFEKIRNKKAGAMIPEITTPAKP